VCWSGHGCGETRERNIHINDGLLRPVFPSGEEATLSALTLPKLPYSDSVRVDSSELRATLILPLRMGIAMLEDMVVEAHCRDDAARIGFEDNGNVTAKEDGCA
jgi:hypothetical protein